MNFLKILPKNIGGDRSNISKLMADDIKRIRKERDDAIKGQEDFKRSVVELEVIIGRLRIERDLLKKSKKEMEGLETELSQMKIIKVKSEKESNNRAKELDKKEKDFVGEIEKLSITEQSEEGNNEADQNNAPKHYEDHKEEVSDKKEGKL
eukprot:GFUD01113737.1.p1 GENE.GFUD01113737.1~~GFUD01113737.1.p1  ORF type:complete len:151 (-),score=57.15 GFUD01113737.1:49-501(-)